MGQAAQLNHADGCSAKAQIPVSLWIKSCLIHDHGTNCSLAACMHSCHRVLAGARPCLTAGLPAFGEVVQGTCALRLLLFVGRSTLSGRREFNVVPSVDR